MVVGSAEGEEEEGGRWDEMQRDEQSWTAVAAVEEEQRLEDGEGTTEDGTGERTLLHSYLV